MTDHEVRYFGRKRGKSFQRLERFEKFLDIPSKQIFTEMKKVPKVLEIGIGDGIKISEDAKNNNKNIYIGCDIFIDGVLRATKFKLENKLDNLFIFHLNVQSLIKLFDNNFLQETRIFFPDPWPKNKHKNRRTFNSNLLKQLSSKMRKNSILKFSTDHADYFLDAMILSSKYGFKSYNNTPNMWQYSAFNATGTKYEKKALDKNNKLFYFSVLKY